MGDIQLKDKLRYRRDKHLSAVVLFVEPPFHPPLKGSHNNCFPCTIWMLLADTILLTHIHTQTSRSLVVSVVAVVLAMAIVVTATEAIIIIVVSVIITAAGALEGTLFMM